MREFLQHFQNSLTLYTPEPAYKQKETFREPTGTQPMGMAETPERARTSWNGVMDYTRTRKRGNEHPEDRYSTPPRKPTILSHI